MDPAGYEKERRWFLKDKNPQHDLFNKL